MKSVSLKNYIVRDLNFFNHVSGDVSLDFSNSVSYKVNFHGNEFCDSELNVKVFDENKPDTIGVEMTICGYFEINDRAQSKEKLHLASFEELFPFAKSVISLVSTTCGVPPIMLRDVDISKNEIFRFSPNGEDVDA